MKTFTNGIIRSTVLLFFFIAMFQALAGLPGESKPAVLSVEKTVAEFNTICIDQDLDLYVFEGTGQKVIIEADENIINDITANVTNGCLNIFSYHKIKKNTLINVYVTVTALHKITTSCKNNLKFFNKPEDLDLYLDNSSSSLKLNLNTPKLNLNIYGKGSVALNGNFEELSFRLYDQTKVTSDVNTNILKCEVNDYAEADLSGICETFMINAMDEGVINSGELLAKNCLIKIRDSGEVYVYVGDELDITGEHDGYIEYKGEPALKTNISKGVVIKNKKDKFFAIEK
ncbi:MAG: DUF2807 domain-containing protein [Bacteroidia bacterium]|nr:DUF2807 domain-containing protein [Bacteroidia bacterium]